MPENTCLFHCFCFGSLCKVHMHSIFVGKTLPKNTALLACFAVCFGLFVFLKLMDNGLSSYLDHFLSTKISSRLSSDKAIKTCPGSKTVQQYPATKCPAANRLRQQSGNIQTSDITEDQIVLHTRNRDETQLNSENTLGTADYLQQDCYTTHVCKQ